MQTSLCLDSFNKTNETNYMVIRACCKPIWGQPEKQGPSAEGLFLLHNKRTGKPASIKSSLSSALGGWVDALYLRLGPARPSPLSQPWLFKSQDYNSDVSLLAFHRIIILNNIFSQGFWLELSLHHQTRGIMLLIVPWFRHMEMNTRKDYWLLKSKLAPYSS